MVKIMTLLQKYIFPNVRKKYECVLGHTLEVRTLVSVSYTHLDVYKRQM